MLIRADARQIPLRDETVQCVITSPPYWSLRDYGLEPSVWPNPSRKRTTDIQKELTLPTQEVVSR